MSTEYINTVRTHFGPRGIEKAAPAQVVTYGTRRELVIDFDYANLPTNHATDAVIKTLPANAAITGATLLIQETFLGGTSLEFGTITPAGVAVDADGLIPAAVGAVANLVAGYVICGRGAQVIEAPDAAGTAHVDADGVYAAGANGPIASVASQIKGVAVGTFTAGKARLIVSYIVPAL